MIKKKYSQIIIVTTLMKGFLTFLFCPWVELKDPDSRAAGFWGYWFFAWSFLTIGVVIPLLSCWK